MSIPGLEHWLGSPQGRYALGWEQAQVAAAVEDVFGFNALQLGLPELDYLSGSRIPFRQKAGEPGLHGPLDAHCDLRQLPFAANSIDLVILPHVLEFYDEPHQILREVERVLIPDGQLILTGFNPYSLWGAKRWLARRSDEGTDFPWCGNYLSPLRARDWLQLLSFEVDRGSYGCYRPPCASQTWLQRWRFVETGGERWWPFAGGIYLLRAIKRVHSMRLVMPRWNKTPKRAKALTALTQKESPRGQ